MSKFYSVRIDKKSWTKDAVGVDFFTSRGCEVAPARRVGDLDVWMQGKKVAILFSSKSAAASYAFSV